MTVNRRKKVTKYRGHSTHGCGSRKKRRGKGSIGGAGRAGTGKRAGQKKAGMPPQLGRNNIMGRGFVNVPALNRRKIQTTINVGDLTSQKIKRWADEGKAKKEGAFYALDLGSLGYDKLLGAGSTDLKLKIKVNWYSASAEEKVKAAGGEVVSEQVVPEAPKQE